MTCPEKEEESLLTQQRRFLAYAAPTCMLIVSPFGLSFVSIMFAGWQNKELLSGVALGNTTYNIFLMSVMCGFCSLLSTYGPQVLNCFNSDIMNLYCQLIILVAKA